MSTPEIDLVRFQNAEDKKAAKQKHMDEKFYEIKNDLILVAWLHRGDICRYCRTGERAKRYGALWRPNRECPFSASQPSDGS